MHFQLAGCPQVLLPPESKTICYETIPPLLSRKKGKAVPYALCPATYRFYSKIFWSVEYKRV